MKIFVQPKDSINHGSNLIAYSAFSTVTLVAILVSLLGIILGYPPVVYLVTLGAIVAAICGYVLWNSGYPVLSTSIHFSGLILAGIITHVVSGTIGGAAGILYLAAVITCGGLLGWKGVKYGIPIIVIFAIIGMIFHPDIRVFLELPDTYQVTEVVLATFVFSSIPCWGAYVVLIDVSNRTAWRKALQTNEALLIEQEQLREARLQQSKLIKLGLLANGDTKISEIEEQCYLAFIEHVPNGEELWQRVSADENQVLEGLMALSQDVPFAYKDFVKGLGQILKTKQDYEKILHEKEAIAEEWQREQRLSSLVRMAGGVAHDFNNFLMVIMALADDLSMGKTLSESQKKSLETILLTTQHASKMTRQLMYFSRGIALKEKVVDVTAVIKETYPIYFQMVPQFIKLEVETDLSDYGVFMPSNQIERIVLNLIRNSISAIPIDHPDARIVLRVAFEKNSSHPKLKNEPSIFLSITDNGQGMDKQTLERAVEPYFSKNQSTGLGLSTVHGLIEYLNGALELRSVIGEGTTITVHFPAYPLPVEEDIDATNQQLSDNKLVLLIDDELLVRKSISLLLKKLGWEVLEASTGAIALRVYQPRVSFVVCDVRLGSEIGFSVVKDIRNLGFQGSVLYVTGFSGQYDEQLRKNERIIGKPFRFQEFQKVLEDLGFSAS